MSWDGSERRASGFDVRSELLAEIHRADDKTERTRLMLLFGVFEQGARNWEQLNKKLEELFGDDTVLRRKVLAEHAEHHPKHHEWVAEQMIAQEELANANKSTARKLLDAALTQAVTIIVSVLATATFISNYLPGGK